MREDSTSSLGGEGRKKSRMLKGTWRIEDRNEEKLAEQERREEKRGGGKRWIGSGREAGSRNQKKL